MYWAKICFTVLSNYWSKFCSLEKQRIDFLLLLDQLSNIFLLWVSLGSHTILFISHLYHIAISQGCMNVHLLFSFLPFLSTSVLPFHSSGEILEAMDCIFIVLQPKTMHNRGYSECALKLKVNSSYYHVLPVKSSLHELDQRPSCGPKTV